MGGERKLYLDPCGALWSYVSLSSIKNKTWSGKANILNSIKDVVDMFGFAFFTDTEDKEVDSHL